MSDTETKTPLTREGLFASFDQMSDENGRIDTTADWLADTAMLIANEQTAALVGENAELKKKLEKTCKWTEDEDGLWATECGKHFDFLDDDGPTENQFRFCCFCGGTCVPILTSDVLAEIEREGEDG